MPTIAEKFFKILLEDKALHQAILKQIKEISPDKLDAVMGRKGRIIVTGPEGGTFTVRLTQFGPLPEKDDNDLRNKAEMTDDTLIEIAVWIANLPGKPGMSPRKAYVNGLIKFEGDSVLYDVEEIFSALEKTHAFAKMGPIVKVAVEEMEQGKSGDS